MSQVLCIHLVDGVIVFGRDAGRTKSQIELDEPLVLSKYFDLSGEVKLMLSRYDNFGIPDHPVSFFTSGVISIYEVDKKTSDFYDNYVDQYSILETDPDSRIEDMDWPTDEPAPPLVKETMSSITNSAKPVDIEKLRKETIRVVWDADKKDD
jgi:hypothetical protein